MDWTTFWAVFHLKHLVALDFSKQGICSMHYSKEKETRRAGTLIATERSFFDEFLPKSMSP
jgi:hypothetical protein